MRIDHRPEIDGLKGIGILSVIFYHGNFTIFGKILFPGGFVGIDILFVISGYLFTSLILKEMLYTKDFSFKNFFENRARRLLPPLLFVILLSLPFAWFFLLPDDFVSFSKSIISTISFNSNLFIYYAGNAFSELNSSTKPFLHSWTLSILIQFYIIFSLVFFIILKYFRNYFLVILFIFIVINILFVQFSGNFNTTFPFFTKVSDFKFAAPSNFFNAYFLQSRLWEILVGSLLAYFNLNIREQQKIDNNNYKSLKQTLPILGLIFIFLSIIFFNDQMFHPSFYTLLPIIGVCLIVLFSHKDELLTKILSSKIFVGIGLISYSLYLWHFPVFAFARVTEFAHGDIVRKILLGIIIFLLSIFSYSLIEKPARNKDNQFKLIFFAIFTLIIINMLFNFIVIAKKGHLRKYPEIILNAYKNLDYRQIQQNDLSCHNRLGDKGFCTYNISEKNIGDIILLGDSLTHALLGNFIKKVKKTDFRLIHMSYSGNIYLPGFFKVNKKNNKIENDERHKFREKFINNSSPNSYIVILARYHYYFEKGLDMDDEENIFTFETPNKYIDISDINLNYDQRIKKLKSKFQNTLYELSKNNKIILLYPLPQPPKEILDRINSNYEKNLYDNENYFYEDKVNYDKSLYLEFHKDIIEFFDQIDSKNIYKIKTENIFCPKEKCLFYDNKFAYFFDAAHPSYKGSEMLNDIIFEKINKIEKDRKNTN